MQPAVLPPLPSLPQPLSAPVPPGSPLSWKQRLALFFSTVQQAFLSTCYPSLATRKVSVHSSQNASAKSALPSDPLLHKGKLENGLAYYIRHNAYPFSKKAYFRLVVRAGHLNETPAEKGVAHLIEHIVQMETKEFKKNEIFTYLESKGVHWSRDNNATTSSRETVYELDIPIENIQTLDQSLRILREVAFHATLSDELIHGEREIIIDELKLRQGPALRYLSKKQEILLAGTPYAHLVDRVAEMKNIRECSPEVVRAFYKRWYQPHNMAVIAVGDFSSEEVKKLIFKHFSSTPASSLPPSLHPHRTQELDQNKILCFSDPELTTSQAEIYWRLPLVSSNGPVTLKQMKVGHLSALVRRMLANRLSDLSMEENPPFIQAAGRKVELIPDSHYFHLFAFAKEGELPKAIKQLLLEVKRIRTHGFLPSEFERAKQAFESDLDHLIREKGKHSADTFIDLCLDHFLENAPAVNPDDYIGLKKKTLPAVTLKEVNAFIPVLFPDRPFFVGTVTPAKPDLTPLTEEMVKTAIEESKKESVKPYADAGAVPLLLKTVPAPVKIEKTTWHPKSKITEYALKNGLKVLVKPTQFSNDFVGIELFARRGERDVELRHQKTARLADSFFAECGIGEVSAKNLTRVLNGKKISFAASTGPYTTNISVKTIKKSLEPAFQMLHLMFTNPGYERSAFERTIKKCKELVRNRHQNPNWIFYQTINTTNTQDHPEFRMVTMEDLAEVNYENCVNIHRQFHANPADFTLAVVGNVEPREIQSFAERYLASLPQRGAKQIRNDYPPVPFPPGITRKEVHGGKDKNAISYFTFPTFIEDTKRDRLQAIWCCDLLELRLNKTLRLTLGKTYSQESSFQNSRVPGLNRSFAPRAVLSFTSDPLHVKLLEEEAFREIKALQEEGPTAQELEDYKKILREDETERWQTNGGWLSFMTNQTLWNRSLEDLEERKQELEQFNCEAVKAMMRKIFNFQQFSCVILHPQKDRS